MASYKPSYFYNLIPDQNKHDREEEFTAYKKYEDMASALPAADGIALRKYQNFWYPVHLAATTIAIQDTFRARPTDVILVSQPKSGTTWIKALIFSIINRANYSFDDQHPLLKHSPHDCFPFLHTLYEDKSVPSAFLNSMPSPRLLAMHIPFSSLPVSIAESGCRMIYICRELKDMILSMWHYESTIYPEQVIPLDMYAKMVCSGVSSFGPVWGHMLEYWKQSLDRPEQVLFLKYEDLVEDTEGNLKRIAHFLGYPFDQQEEEKGMVQEIVNLCDFEHMRSIEVNKNGEHGVVRTFKNSAFFRKGKVGDWKNHMSLEMAESVDAVMERKLQGSGLTFRK